MRGAGEFLHAHRAVGEQIGERKFRRNVDGLHHHGRRPQQLLHLHERGTGFWFCVAHVCLMVVVLT